MKRFSFLLMAGLMALGFGACSDEVDVSKEGEEQSGKVYMSFDLELPSSRSATDGTGNTNSDAIPDSEVGKDFENTVTSIKVVLATVKDGQYEMLAESTPSPLVGSGSNYTVTFQSDEFKGMSGTDNVYVFVVCNPTAQFTTYALFTGNGTVEEDDLTLGNSIAKKGAFLMTNAELSKPVTIPEDLKPYNSPSYPFDLGVVKVERTAARFDYKSGATNDTYQIQESETVNSVVRPSVSIQLTHMALVNMSKNYYWLRRVANATDETLAQYDANKITLCGLETPRNYVVDTDAAEKLAGAAISFHYSSTEDGVNVDPTTLEYTKITDITGEKGTDDNWQGENEIGDYKIWRYVTENTLPSIATQQTKYSTGVVFKGKMVEGNEDDAIKLLDGENKAYVFKNVLYGTWEKVTDAATQKNGDGSLVDPELNLCYNIAAAKMKKGEIDPEKADAVNAGFTVYEPNDDGDYEVFYYYWNRHNDNKNSHERGIMEFAVVRNNVYKLSVTGIDMFGHPGEPTGDPDDPDEDDKVYFRVGVQVLPWVVRVNNIDF